MLGVGQIATGYVAIGQVVLAYYGLGQIGLGEFLWTMSRRDGEAVQFFLSWWDYLKQLITSTFNRSSKTVANTSLEEVKRAMW